MNFKLTVEQSIDENNFVTLTFLNPYLLEGEEPVGPKRHHTRTIPHPVDAKHKPNEQALQWIIDSLTAGISVKMYQDNGFVAPPKKRKRR